MAGEETIAIITITVATIPPMSIIALTPTYTVDGITANGTHIRISTITDVHASDFHPVMSEHPLPLSSNSTFNDIFLVSMGEFVFVVPKTAAGMIWLQTHFDQNEWENLAASQVTISQGDAEMLRDDARRAGLNIYYD